MRRVVDQGNKKPRLALVGACCVSVLRMPLASVMIATLLSARAGLEVAPLVVIAVVVVAYLASEALSAYVDVRVGEPPPPQPLLPDQSRLRRCRATAP